MKIRIVLVIVALVLVLVLVVVAAAFLRPGERSRVALLMKRYRRAPKRDRHEMQRCGRSERGVSIASARHYWYGEFGDAFGRFPNYPFGESDDE